MEKDISMPDVERRLAALGKAVASLTAEKKGKHDNEPRGKFAHIGGKTVAHSVPVQTAKPIDFSSIGGKCVCKAS